MGGLGVWMEGNDEGADDEQLAINKVRMGK